MVAYLEKNDGNTEFHQIIDFLTRSSIHFALTVSPIVSTSFVEQFWTSAKSRTVNKISYIDAIFVGKPVTISEASIRSDLLFDDADGIDTLNNQAIFDTIQLMGYEGDLNTLTFNKALISPQWKFLFHTMNHCISSKSTFWDQIPTNIATAVICLTTNQKYNFSKLIFDGMMRYLDASKKFVMYPIFLQIFLRNQLKDVPVPMDYFPVPTLTKKVLTFMVKKGKNFSGNVTPLFDTMLVQPTEDEAEVSERPSESQPIPSHTHPKGSGENHGGQSSSDRSLSGNEDGLTLQSVYDLCISLCTQVTAQAAEIKTSKAQIKQLKKKARQVINHHKAWFRAARLKKHHKLTDMEKLKKRRSVSKQERKAVKSSKGASSVHTHTDWDAMDTDLEDYTLTQDEGTDKESTDLQQSTIKQNEGTDKQSTDLQQSTVKQNEGTDKQNEGTDKTRVSTDIFVEGTAEIKDQVSRESDTPTVPTMTSVPTPIVFGDDETIAQVLVTMNAESEGVNEVERKFAQLANDEEIAIKARIEADSILAARLQEEEREKFTIEERAKLLHDTIAAQRRFLAQQRAAEIRSKLPIRTQLRNQMMTYLKHVGRKKHSDLKTNNFEEKQVLYEKVKRSDENFIAIGSAEDERRIKDVNKKAIGIKKDDNTKEEDKEDESTRKRKLGTRKKIKSRKRRFKQDTSQDDQTDSERENDELRLCLTIAIDEDKEVDYEILDKKYPIIEWKMSTLELNHKDVNAVYQLVMDRYQDVIPEGVHTLMTEAGLVIHMLVEKKYPLRRKVPLQMLELKLESKEDSTMALELIRFVKKLIAKLEHEDSDGNKEDL
ncbi:hypothetical protein Tco_0933748 [Tanacetum coccineum]